MSSSSSKSNDSSADSKMSVFSNILHKLQLNIDLYKDNIHRAQTDFQNRESYLFNSILHEENNNISQDPQMLTNASGLKSLKRISSNPPFNNLAKFRKMNISLNGQINSAIQKLENPKYLSQYASKENNMYSQRINDLEKEIHDIDLSHSKGECSYEIKKTTSPVYFQKYNEIQKILRMTSSKFHHEKRRYNNVSKSINNEKQKVVVNSEINQDVEKIIKQSTSFLNQLSRKNEELEEQITAYNTQEGNILLNDKIDIQKELEIIEPYESTLNSLQREQRDFVKYSKGIKRIIGKTKQKGLGTFSFFMEKFLRENAIPEIQSRDNVAVNNEFSFIENKKSKIDAYSSIMQNVEKYGLTYDFYLSQIQLSFIKQELQLVNILFEDIEKASKDEDSFEIAGEIVSNNQQHLIQTIQIINSDIETALSSNMIKMINNIYEQNNESLSESVSQVLLELSDQQLIQNHGISVFNILRDISPSCLKKYENLRSTFEKYSSQLHIDKTEFSKHLEKVVDFGLKNKEVDIDDQLRGLFDETSQLNSEIESIVKTICNSLNNYISEIQQLYKNTGNNYDKGLEFSEVFEEQFSLYQDLKTWTHSCSKGLKHINKMFFIPKDSSSLISQKTIELSKKDDS